MVGWQLDGICMQACIFLTLLLGCTVHWAVSYYLLGLGQKPDRRSILMSSNPEYLGAGNGTIMFGASLFSFSF